jgi:serine/threonine protein kinase
MLIEYLPSESLDNVPLTPSEKYAASAYILDALSDLESRGYYPQDLKLPNILLSHDSQMVHIVDLGNGITEGMFRVGSEWRLLQGNTDSRDVCYAFGKTLLYLFSDEDSDETAMENLPPLIHTIVFECCGDQLEPDIQVHDFRTKYSVSLMELASKD